MSPHVRTLSSARASVSPVKRVRERTEPKTSANPGRATRKDARESCQVAARFGVISPSYARKTIFRKLSIYLRTFFLRVRLTRACTHPRTHTHTQSHSRCLLSLRRIYIARQSDGWGREVGCFTIIRFRRRVTLRGVASALDVRPPRSGKRDSRVPRREFR